MNRWIAKAFSWINTCVPKDPRRVVFCSFPDYSDNARAVYEEMCRVGLDKTYRLSWLVNGNTPPELQGTCFVKQHSLRGFWHYCRAKYVFHTHGLFGNCPAKKQVVVSLWHGMPLKNIMKLDATHPADEVFRFTYTLATSPLFQQIMGAAFGCEEARCLLTGQPRNDALFQPSDILSRMHIDRAAYARLILWMPTYRQSGMGDVRCDGGGGRAEGLAFLTRSQLNALNEELAQIHSLLLVKLHPMQVPIAVENVAFSHIRFLREIPGVLYHLVGQADALLTDCSSVYVDYLMLDRPIGFVFDDLTQYRQNRGFVFDDITAYMPGPFLEDYAALVSFLRDVAASRDTYAAARHAVRAQCHTYVDDQSSHRLLKEVFSL